MTVLHARVAKETVAFMQRASSSGNSMGQRLISAREDTQHYKHEDSVVLEEGPPDKLQDTVIEVTLEDTLVAAQRLISEGYREPCVLNFADAFKPGGLFLQGVTTQEERLARCTGLHWCIKDQPYYERNIQSSGNRSLYLHDILYSSNVPVFRDLNTEGMLGEASVYPISIVTSPAPQAYEAMMSCSSEEVSSTLRERIRRILSVMANNKHKAVVLGAFGCGAFGNDPEMVAAHFKTWLLGDFQGCFKKVVFAIHETEDFTNLNTFRRIIDL